MGLFSRKKKPAKRKPSIKSNVRKVNRGMRGFSRLIKSLTTHKTHKGMKY